MTGVVMRFNAAKGFGFIQPEGGAEVFVHVSGLKAIPEPLHRSLRPGDNVAFDVVPTSRGLRAVNVELIEEPQPNQTPEG